MAERREWVLIGLVLLVGLAAMLLFFPSGRAGAPYSRLSSNLTAPSGAKALYLTMGRMGIGVERWEAPLADVGPLPRALAVLAPDESLTPREASAVLDMVRKGGSLLWIPGMGGLWGSRLADSLGLGLTLLPDSARVQVRAYPWTEGMEHVDGFRLAFRSLDSLGARAKPLLVAKDTVARDSLARDMLVLAFVAHYGSGTILGISDPAPLENANIAHSGIAPLLVRAGAAAAVVGGGALVFDEFHHGFRGGSVRAGVADFLMHERLGHVVAQLLLVGFLALILVSTRMGAPTDVRRIARRSPLEHVEALGQVYREASAVTVPSLRLLGGLARTLGEPSPRGEAEASELLRRIERRGGDAAPVASRLRERLEGGEADVLAVAMDIDRIREELGR